MSKMSCNKKSYSKIIMYMRYYSLVYKSSYQKYHDSKSIQNSTRKDLFLCCFPLLSAYLSCCFDHPALTTRPKHILNPSHSLFVTFLTYNNRLKSFVTKALFFSNYFLANMSVGIFFPTYLLH